MQTGTSLHAIMPIMTLMRAKPLKKRLTWWKKPWEIPSWSTFDVSAGYTFDFGKIRATLSGNVNNLFNQEYIADARDGSNHDWETATRVIYGWGRTYTVRLKLNF